MIKTIGFLLLWLAGSAAAIAVAWTGVSIVDDELIHPAPASHPAASGAPIASEEVPTPQRPTPSSTSSTISTPSSASGDDSSTIVDNPADSSTTATSQPTATMTDTSSSNPSSSTTPEPTTSPRSTATTGSAQTLSFKLIGGSTAISFSATGVEAVWATPNPGFTVNISPEGTGIKVEFEADHHESRIEAWWAGGPQHEIREKADD